MKRIFKLLILIGCLIGIARFTHHETRGFRIAKIRDNLAHQQLWLPDAADQPCDLLQQPFSFFSRGLQSFVFLSADGQYVLKIFNNRHSHLQKWFDVMAHLPGLHAWGTARALHHKMKWEKSFNSYKIAYERLRDETGIVYIHLDPTDHLPTTLNLIDPLGITHSIDPNQTGFILQKRCTPVYPVLLQAIEKGDLEAARRCIDQLIALFLLKYQQGIADNDPLIRTNYGFLNGQPMQIDLGPLSLDPNIQEKEVYLPELRKTMHSLKNWLHLHCEELNLYLEEQLP